MEIDLRSRDGERMVERNQLAGALGRHDARQARHLQHVALGQCLVADQGRGGRLHPDPAAGAGDALGLRLAADVHHPAGAGGVEVGQFSGHGSFSRRAGAPGWADRNRLVSGAPATLQP